MNHTAVENLALVAFAAVGVISVWSLFDRRVPDWLINAMLSLAFAAFALTQESGALFWACLAVAAIGAVAAVVRFRRARSATTTAAVEAAD